MNRRGLTLLELLTVMVILSILASMTFWLLRSVENSRITATDGQVRTLGFEAATYAKLKGFPPAALEQLAPRLGNPGWIKDGRFVDAWERPIGYRVDGKNFTVWSSGPDGVSGTADDLKFERN